MRKVLGILRQAGVTGLLSRAVAYAYRRGVRPCLPSSGLVRYAGIPVGTRRKWGDNMIPSLWLPANVRDVPDYEFALVAGLKEHVRAGDRVVVVGGGIGVTATIAALHVGSTGSVECFEGASEAVDRVRRTAAINGVSQRLTVHHAVVARSISVYGTVPSHAIVPADRLPACDVLELDCEGAELDILHNMVCRPRAILVETHGLYGASSELVTSAMEKIGYAVKDFGVAEPRIRAFCETNDIRVLVGVLRHEELTP